MPKNGHDEKHIDPYGCYISPGSGKSDKHFGISVVCACSPGQLKEHQNESEENLIHMHTFQRQIFAMRLRLSSWQFGGEECPNE